jgi:hypothetical protein
MYIARIRSDMRAMIDGVMGDCQILMYINFWSDI